MGITEQAQPKRSLSRPEIVQFLVCGAVIMAGFCLVFLMGFIVPDSGFGTLQLAESLGGFAMMLLGYRFMPKWSREPTV